MKMSKCDLKTIRIHLIYWIRVQIRNPNVSICKNNVLVMGQKPRIFKKIVFCPFCDTARKWALAKWLERLAVNAKVATLLGSMDRSQHPPTQWNLRAADETVLNKVIIKNPKINPPFCMYILMGQKRTLVNYIRKSLHKGPLRLT